MTAELNAPIHRDLVAYAKVLERQTGQTVLDSIKRIAPIVDRFMATDRGFAKLRRLHASANSPPGKRDWRKQHLAQSRL